MTPFVGDHDGPADPVVERLMEFPGAGAGELSRRAGAAERR